MISAISTTRSYVLQPGLIKKHKKTLQWLSSILLWKSELMFFQKALEEKSALLIKVADKKKVDHFQNLFIYYGGEVLDELRSKLRQHEKSVASMLETKNELLTRYFEEHDELMDELETFAKTYLQLKKDFSKFISANSKKKKK